MAEEKLDTEVRRRADRRGGAELVADQGLRRLSVAAVARRVGLVPSGIYRHFKSKDEILAAVFDRIEQRLLANVAGRPAENADPLECLKGVLMRHIRFIREGRAIPRMIFSDDVHGRKPRAPSGASWRFSAAILGAGRRNRPPGPIARAHPRRTRPANRRHDALGRSSCPPASSGT